MAKTKRLTREQLERQVEALSRDLQEVSARAGLLEQTQEEVTRLNGENNALIATLEDVGKQKKLLEEARQQAAQLIDEVGRYRGALRRLEDMVTANRSKTASEQRVLRDMAAVLAALLAGATSPAELMKAVIETARAMSISPSDSLRAELKIALNQGYSVQVEAAVDKSAMANSMESLAQRFGLPADMAAGLIENLMRSGHFG